MWKESGFTKDLKDIAAALDVPAATIRVWKNRDKWEEKAKETLNETLNETKRNVSNITIRVNGKKLKEVDNSQPNEDIEDDEPEKGLTAKQQLFVTEYLRDLNATQAAIRAGYSRNRPSEIGYQLLQKTKVQTALTEALQQRAEAVELNTEWVLERFKLISDRCIQAEPVTDRDGNPLGEYRFDAAGANKAAEMIGKHLGMFTHKMPVEHSTEVSDTNNRDDAIIEKIIEKYPDVINIIFGGEVQNRTQ
jgi:phage terminase small subunit